MRPLESVAIRSTYWSIFPALPKQRRIDEPASAYSIVKEPFADQASGSIDAPSTK